MHGSSLPKGDFEYFFTKKVKKDNIKSALNQNFVNFHALIAPKCSLFMNDFFAH